MLKNDTKLISLWDIPLALVLLTRLPVPRLPEHVFARQAESVWAFPLVGLVVGFLACAVGWVSETSNLPTIVSAVLIVSILVIATGAMHEDGLADSADGFWGGFTPERRLEIMKDSQIGTYGVLTLILSQSLRVALIATVLSAGGFAGVLAACIGSRAVMPVLMAGLPNARSSGLSHSVGAPGTGAVMLGVSVALALSLLLVGAVALVPILACAISAAAVAALATNKIGGQTGDVLGAAQQLSEIAFLLALAVIL